MIPNTDEDIKQKEFQILPDAVQTDPLFKNGVVLPGTVIFYIFYITPFYLMWTY